MEGFEETSIFTFIHMNNVNGVKDCIKNKINLNSHNNGNNSNLNNYPIYEALRKRWLIFETIPFDEEAIINNLEIINLLLLNISDIDIWIISSYDNFSFTHTLLNLAIGRKDLEIIKLLLKYHSNPNQQNFIVMYDENINETVFFPNGQIQNNSKLISETYPLELAILSLNVDIVKCLVENGVDTTKYSNDDTTKIIYKSIHNDNFDIFIYFLENNIIDKDLVIEIELQMMSDYYDLKQTLRKEQVMILLYLLDKINFIQLKKLFMDIYDIPTYFLSLLKVDNQSKKQSLIKLYSQKVYEGNRDISLQIIFREMVWIHRSDYIMFVNSLSEHSNNSSLYKCITDEYLTREVAKYIYC
jgi:hypothetical protein